VRRIRGIRFAGAKYFPSAVMVGDSSGRAWGCWLASWGRVGFCNGKLDGWIGAGDSPGRAGQANRLHLWLILSGDRSVQRRTGSIVWRIISTHFWWGLTQWGLESSSSLKLRGRNRPAACVSRPGRGDRGGYHLRRYLGRIRRRAATLVANPANRGIRRAVNQGVVTLARILFYVNLTRFFQRHSVAQAACEIQALGQPGMLVALRVKSAQAGFAVRTCPLRPR